MWYLCDKGVQASGTILQRKDNDILWNAYTAANL